MVVGDDCWLVVVAGRGSGLGDDRREIDEFVGEVTG